MSERVERFGALYEAHHAAIYAYVYRRLGHAETEVADVVADVFVVAWRRLDDVPAGDEALLWLYGVAMRCVLRSRRSASRRTRLLARLVEDTRTRPPTGGPGSREEEVRGAIERLPPRDREVLRLVMWEGLRHGEAATVLGCSTNAVAQRLRAARERLRAELTAPPDRSSEVVTGK